MSTYYVEYLDSECFILSEKLPSHATYDIFYMNSCTLGDFDDNGSCDLRDAAYLIRASAGYTFPTDQFSYTNGDYNGDGVIDLQDVCGVIRHTAGWDTDYNLVEVQTELECALLPQEEMNVLIHGTPNPPPANPS